MCNHRKAAATWFLNGRRRVRGRVAWSLPVGLAAELDRCGSDLFITGEFLGERPGADGQRLADDLIGPVLAGGLDVEGVVAGLDRLAVVVLAVPDHLVLAGRAGRPGDGLDQVLIVDELADLVILIPL